MENQVLGGGGLRKTDKEIGELKRLYVYSEFRGLGIASVLCAHLLSVAREFNLSRIRLDALERLRPATALYLRLGFKEIDAYCYNPDPTARYCELNLQQYSALDWDIELVSA